MKSRSNISRYGRGHNLTLQRVAIFLLLLVILVLTLRPSGHVAPPPFSFDLVDIPHEMADVVLNFLMFIPLGVALGWRSERVVRVTVFALLLSTAIELSQTHIAGRDPALSDIVFNSLGAFAGAIIGRRPRPWLLPSPRGSLILVATSVCAFALLTIATGLLLAPIPSTPVSGAKPIALSPWTPTPAHEARGLLWIETAGSDVGLFISHSGNQLRLRYPARSAAFGLAQPADWSATVLHGLPDSVITVSFARDRARWQIAVDTVGATLGPTAGQGWALLAYPTASGRRYGALIDLLWMCALCFPIGFWTRTRASAIAAGFLVPILIIVPRLTGILDTTPHQWLGASIGFALGHLVARSSRRFLTRTID